jgi:hypothetical protein
LGKYVQYMKKGKRTRAKCERIGVEKRRGMIREK